MHNKESNSEINFIKEYNEVKNLLTRHLSTKLDSSLAVRSIYGRYLNKLFVLDNEWTKKTLPKIFPSASSLNQFRNTSWDSYLIFSRPSKQSLEQLFDQYNFAIDNILNSFDPDQKSRFSPLNNFAQHLMEFYWSGQIKLNSNQDIITKFFKTAPTKLVDYAIEFIGRSLEITPVVQKEYLERLYILWNIILEILTTNDSSDALTAFGWWVASKKLDSNWAIDQLIKVLHITGKVDMDTKVIEWLSDQAITFPEQSIECLELMIKKSNNNWDIYRNSRQKRIILEDCLSSSSEIAKQAAKSLINFLASKGINDFNDLLVSTKSR